MALSTPRLATGIKDKIISKLGLTIFDATQLQKFAEALSEAVIEEFDANAELEGAVLANNAVAGTNNPITDVVTATVTSTVVTGGIK